MIIKLSLDQLTSDTAEVLAKKMNYNIQNYYNLNLNNCSDEKLIVIDLSADGNFQEMISPRAFVDYLIKCGLSNGTRRLDLYCSDINFGRSLYSFGHEVANYLEDNYKRKIEVRVTTDINFDYTILVPPIITNGNWCVYGVKKSGTPTSEQKLNFQYFNQLPDKVLLWQGQNLDAWLANPSRICQSLADEIGLATKNKP